MIPAEESWPRVRVAGVNDEASPTWNLDEGLDVLDELGIGFVELRAADGKMVDQMTDDEYARVADRVLERGFIVTTYLSRLAQCVPDEANRESELSLLRSALTRAGRVGAKQIRVMGFKTGDDARDWFGAAVALYGEMVMLAADADITLILENPPRADNAPVGTAAACRAALEEVASPFFRMNLDPGNFAAHDEDALAAYDTLTGTIANVHVKDFRAVEGKREYCVAGEGVCQYPEIFRRLRADGFTGYVTAEPHLSHGQQFHTSGRDGFLRAAAAIIHFLEDAGYVVMRRPEEAMTA